MDIFKHCQKNKKIKPADQILPEVYSTTLKLDVCLIFFIFGDALAFNNISHVLLKK